MIKILQMYKYLFKLTAVVEVLFLFSVNASAQFKEEAFTQNYNDQNDTTARDSTDAAFTFKEFFGGVSHKRESRIGVLFAGSTVFVGTQQMYNKQYWKLPVIYGGLVFFFRVCGFRLIALLPTIRIIAGTEGFTMMQRWRIPLMTDLYRHRLPSITGMCTGVIVTIL